jgi:hypothetical protein
MALRRRKTDDAPAADRAALPSLRDLGGPALTDSSDAERYEAWADRLGVKRQVAQASIRDASLQDRPRETGPSYWTEDILFMDAASNDELQRVADPTPEQLREFFQLLEVPDDASLPEITQSYRVLAKKHHPDLFIEADDETRARNEAKMRAINIAHRVLSKRMIEAQAETADEDQAAGSPSVIDL